MNDFIRGLGFGVWGLGVGLLARDADARDPDIADSAVIAHHNGRKDSIPDVIGAG